MKNAVRVWDDSAMIDGSGNGPETVEVVHGGVTRQVCAAILHNTVEWPHWLMTGRLR